MDGGYAVGVDLGATNVRAAVGDNKGRILRKLSEKTDKQHGPEGISAQIIRMIRLLLREFEPETQGIGIGSIGPLDLVKGAITGSPNIPFNFVPLTEPLKNEFRLPVALLNDCNAAVVGERGFGAGRGVYNLAYITLSSGIGGGVYVDGRLLLGKDGNAAEVGHMVIDFEGRLECGCGRRGHWEAYCSGENIPKYVSMLLAGRPLGDGPLTMLSSGDPLRITPKVLYEAARDGDALALGIVESIGRLNAVGFANVINAYDPSLITVGGTLALKHEDLILKPIKSYVDDYAINRVPDMRITPLGEDAVLLGAMAMAYKMSLGTV